MEASHIASVARGALKAYKRYVTAMSQRVA